MLKQGQYNQQSTQFLVDGLTNGFSIQYQGDKTVQRKAPNLKLRVGNQVQLWNKVMKEVKLLRYAGPYETVPFEYYIQSPIGLVPKSNGDKRLIFHLSYPKDGTTSVNVNTPQELCTVKYTDFSEAIVQCMEECQIGSGLCYTGKSDATSTFRTLGLNHESWAWLIMKAKSPIDNKIYYFVINACLLGAQ